MTLEKTDRRVLKTKKLIREAFFLLLSEKDISNITITDIAKSANIDRKTFYLHYSSSTDILDEFEEEKTEILRQSLSACVTDNQLDVNQFYQSLTHMLEEEDILLYKRIVKTNSYSMFHSRIKECLKHFMLTTLFATTKMTNKECEIYAEFISAGLVSVFVEWLKSDSNMPLETLTKIAIDATFHAGTSLIY